MRKNNTYKHTKGKMSFVWGVDEPFDRVSSSVIKEGLLLHIESIQLYS